MQTKSRKYIITLGIALVVLVLLALFIVFRSTKSGGGESRSIFSGILPDTGGGGADNGSGDGGSIGDSGDSGDGDVASLPDEEKRRLVQLTKDPVVGAATKYGEEKIVYFKRGEGNIFEIPFDGSAPEERILHFTIPNIAEVEWSPKRTYAVISAIGEDSLKHLWINITSTSTLDSGFFSSDTGDIEDVAFSPTEDKIAMAVQNETGSVILISDPRGKNQKRIATIPVFGSTIKWVAKNLLVMQTRPSAFSASLLATINPQTGASGVLMSNAEGLDTLWDGAGNNFLAFETQNKGKNIALYLRSRADPENGTEQKRVTFPEKCAFSKKATSTVYCAFPKEWPREALPDGWWQGKISFSDDIWVHNLGLGDYTHILSGGGFDIINPFLSDDERFIFFINKKDSTLWSLRLRD